MARCPLRRVRFGPDRRGLELRLALDRERGSKADQAMKAAECEVITGTFAGRTSRLPNCR